MTCRTIPHTHADACYAAHPATRGRRRLRALTPAPAPPSSEKTRAPAPPVAALPPPPAVDVPAMTPGAPAPPSAAAPPTAPAGAVSASSPVNVAGRALGPPGPGPGTAQRPPDDPVGVALGLLALAVDVCTREVAHLLARPTPSARRPGPVVRFVGPPAA